MPCLSDRSWTYSYTELNDRVPEFIYKREEGNTLHTVVYEDKRAAVTEAIGSPLKRMCN